MAVSKKKDKKEVGTAWAAFFTWPTPSTPRQAVGLCLLQPNRGFRRANGRVQGCPRVLASSTKHHMPEGE